MKYFLFFFCALTAACNDSNTTSNADDTTVTTTAPSDTGATNTQINSTTCYAYHSANDTIMLTLIAAEANVSGNLVYAYSGKDKNSGTLNGIMKGDTLLADYTFMSEGKSSVRQVAFLRKGDGFVEGYGDLKMEGDKMLFRNTGALKFSSTMALQKRPCGNL